MIFVREMSDPLTSLVKKMNQKVNEAAGKYKEGRNLGTYLIINDAPGLADQLRGMAKTEGLQRGSCVSAPRRRAMKCPARRM